MQTENSRYLFKIVENEGFQLRFVGGCVRDKIAGIKSNDIDIAINTNPEITLDILRKNNIKCIPTGMKHGTITVLLSKEKYEITSLRRDVKCFGRHAAVEFTDDWKIDAERRDFTFNAMFMDRNNKIYDYFNGEEDLRNGFLRFIGDPDKRINEDFLRILRLFRFYIRYAKKGLGEEATASIKRNAHNIDSLSGERIKSEVFNILGYKNSAKAIEMMSDMNVSSYVFNQRVSSRFLPPIDSLSNCPMLRLAILVNENNLNIDYIHRRWKLSNDEKKELSDISRNKIIIDSSKNSHIRIIEDYGLEKYEKMLIVSNIKDVVSGKISLEDLSNIFNQYSKFIIPEFPVKGRDIMLLGIEGKGVGLLLRKAKEIWRDSEYRLTKNEIIKSLSDFI